MKPLARYATLSNYVDLARSTGLDPARLVREAGLDPAGLSTHDRWVPAEAIAELLQRSALLSGREDFGLALAEQRRLSHLGPLGLVIREEPDVRNALLVLMRHEHMYNEAFRARMLEHGGLATIRVDLDIGARTDISQSLDLALGVLHRLLQDFLGPTWRPVSVSLTRPAPADPRAYRRLFGSHVEFDQPFDGISVYTADLDSPNKLADPVLRPYAQRFLDTAERPRGSATLERIRDLVELLLPSGRCSIEQVARSLGVDRRTVHRKLTADGSTFTQVRDDVRADLAARLVRSPRHSLTEIAELVGFSSPSNFTRWFTRRFGVTPTQWRVGEDHPP